MRIADPATSLATLVHRAGDGPPMFVLNGLLGLNDHWRACHQRFAAFSECFLVEPPLLELTGDACSVSGVVRMTTAVIERSTRAPAVLAGNSLGGHVAMRIALQRPDLVRALVLIGSSGLFERTFERTMHAPTREWLRQKIEGLFHDPRTVPPGMVDRAYAELSKRSGARALVRLGKSAKNDHLGDEIPRLRVPTLLAWGMQDAVTPPEVAREFHSLIPGSTLTWIDRCGHAPQIEQPDALADAVRSFVESLRAPR